MQSCTLKSAEDCQLGNYEQTNVYFLTGIFLVQKNYQPVGQLPIVKLMARPTKLVAPGVGRCYLSSPVFCLLSAQSLCLIHVLLHCIRAYYRLKSLISTYSISFVLFIYFLSIFARGEILSHLKPVCLVFCLNLLFGVLFKSNA